MAVSLTTTLKNSRLTQVKSANDAGTVGGGKIIVYSGSVPANVGTALSGQTPLVTLTSGAMTAPSGGSSTLTASSGVAGAGGTPTFARFFDSNDNAYAQVAAGVGSGELSFNQAISLGGTVSLSSGTWTEGN